ncbi:hypothetical protein B0T26DRAFT_235088 [Lasiosphaeria miniovina]|uniref:DUF7907 domain-containing protein n=1 Tax=Lasiosphaeria miniovina TaxID=1954250 RepID=A0AA40AVM9_9PEZI|nr:uncharacterized protein B0T26DRAFT_235088 [Lasiosphaeria miniovina]KAK0722806.1 hypothetical protein B0T26DRAFT_235088 [Lasiosphaeria miniovina]
MKFTQIAGVLAALTSSTGVLAQQQTNNQTGPFLLKLTSANETLNGNYLGACHAGAAIEALCLIGKNISTINRSAATFFWNYTIYDGQPSESGSLVWTLQLSGGIMNVSEPLSVTYNPGTNVAVPMLTPGGVAQQVGFNGSTLYVPGYPDDSNFKYGEYPTNLSTTQLTNWQACWLFAGSYYYNALAWVTSGAPHNPTCQAVGVLREDA